jgi:hypothetical protein
MPGDVLHPVSAPSGPLSLLLSDLAAAWQRERIGAAIDEWDARTEAGRSNVLRLEALPPRLRVELAWMAHWQYTDGNKVAVNMFNKAAEALRWMLERNRRPPASTLQLDPPAFTRLYQTWFESRHGRLPTRDSVLEFQRVVCGYPRLALLARCSDQPWWALDTWAPRCDPRIPLRDREPHADQACRPGRLQIPWLRAAVKWHLGTVLEAGILSWTTIGHDRLCGLLLLDRWLTALADAAALTGDITTAGPLAAAFRRWLSDPRNRDARRRPIHKKVGKRQINNGIRAVVELMAFIVDNRAECRAIIGPSPWDTITEAHPAVWGKQIHRLGSVPPRLNDENYVDDHALAQITACLPVLGADRSETVTVTINGHQRQLTGREHPQIMRMLLLQILTGRRASEICLCEFDCISPVSAHSIEATDGEQIARFRYAQSKIEQAPDTILVDAEVVAVVEEQQHWIRERFPGPQPKYLFLSQRANTNGTKFITVPTYQSVLQRFSELVQITDSKGRAVRLSRTHRFRHTRLTRLAELGLPVHVLQRYAGHSSPEMAMHYIAHREEHAEQAFLASRKFAPDGTVVTFSREDHDGMHLFDRADRFLPNGYCLLPPLQTCDKGNACLTCSVFVTDTSHLDTLQRQLAETESLIERTTTQFEHRHGTPMPAENPWLIQRTAEKTALTKIVAAMTTAPGHACQGAGSPTAGPVPITLDTTSHRKRPS